jgi:hypothetical protein
VRVSAHVCSELLHIDSSGRCYMIAVAKPELLKAMRGVSLIGFDAKLDFNIYRFPTYLISFTDAGNHGAVGALVLVSADTAENANTALLVVRWNIPCRRDDCKHPVEFRRHANGQGW